MYWLGIDTSGVELCVCLLADDVVQFRKTYGERRQQGDVLFPLIDEALASAELTLQDLAGLAVVTGPGSFTGLRLGLAAAQGLARASALKVAGYDRFTLLRGALAGQPAAIVLDSLREELFVQLPDQAPAMLTASDIAAQWPGPVCGDGAGLIEGRPVLEVPDAAALAARQMAKDVVSGAALPPLLPCYMRAPDITSPA